MQCLKCGKECPDLDDGYCAECWAESEGEDVNNVDDILERKRGSKNRRDRGSFRLGHDEEPLDKEPDS